VKNYIINIKPTAEKDIEQRYQQIALESPQNAVKWYFDIVEAIQTLNQMAERCPIAPESDDCQSEIRHLIVGNYRVLYQTQNNTVDVLHVRHSAKKRNL
jgi:toxin ParE1/3/4